jgi:uncharacterized protein with ParB-like and HNH nuclease domain
MEVFSGCAGHHFHHVEARTYTIGELLGGDHVFSMPPFQRPYAWGEEEAAQLFDDIDMACQGNSSNNDPD